MSVQDAGFESTAFETLELDFQQVTTAKHAYRCCMRSVAVITQVLTELVGDKSLEKFRQVRFLLLFPWFAFGVWNSHTSSVGV